MEIIMPGQKAKPALHPVAIFQDARKICWHNLGKLAMIYLIFNLPLTLISLSPKIQSLESQKPGPTMWLWLLLLIVISSWGHIALLLAIRQAASAQTYTVGASINQAQGYLVKYLALMASIILFMSGLVITAGVVLALVLALLPQVNMILALLVFLVVVTALICMLVFYVLRWSLASVVCVFENIWAMPALRGSLSLVKNYVDPVAGLYGLTILVYGAGLAPMFLAQMLLKLGRQAGPAQIGMAIYMFLINIILVPLWTTITVVLYNKLKEVLKSHVHA